MSDSTIDPAIRERARKLAEAVSSTLSDSDREYAGELAHTTIRVLLDMAQGNDEIAVTMALGFARAIAEIQQTPLMHVSELTDNTISAYALAAGSISGTYELPEPSEPAPSTSPNEVRVVDRGPNPASKPQADWLDGRYL